MIEDAQVIPATTDGPLAGLKFVEFAGIGPVPFCSMLLSDMGADVIKLDRLVASNLGIPRPTKFDLTSRGRESVALDLKHSAAIELALDLIAQADGLIEGFRPGTMERLGLGPQVCLPRNPRLAYVRITGWGQDGPLAQRVGHDLNYIALNGVLDAIGRAGQPPTPPLNLVGDYGGGGMLGAFGALCGVLSSLRTGKGQVVDAAMIDGSALLMLPILGLRAAGLHSAPRGQNTLDSGMPFYEVYKCADGLYVSIAPLETKFRTTLLRLMELDEGLFADAADPAQWPTMKRILAERFSEKSRDEWCAILEDADVCFAPVLSLDEAPSHPHIQKRGVFQENAGVLQPSVSPRFSATPTRIPTPPEAPGARSEETLLRWGIDKHRIAKLRMDGLLVNRC